MKLILLVLVSFTCLTLSAKENVLPLEYTLAVTDNGFEPSSLKVKANTPITLKVTRKTDSTCALALVIPSKKIKVDLPLNKEVAIKVGKLEKGEIKFGCAMNMMVNAVMIAE